MKSMVKKLKQSLRSGSLEKRKEKEKHIQEEKWFLDNGSIFLTELIADCNGKSIPIRSFSSDQILKATSNFSSSCFVTAEGFYVWYKGIIEDRSYMIKRFSEYKVTHYRVAEVYNEIVLSARMSNHNNFLKLIGFCLEFSLPVLVFEYAEHGVLNHRGALASTSSDGDYKHIAGYVKGFHENGQLDGIIDPKVMEDITSAQKVLVEACVVLALRCFMNHRGAIKVNREEALLPWSARLKIGKKIANALTYLRMTFGVTMLFLLAGELGVQWLAAMIREFGFPFPLSVGKLSEHFIDLIDQTIWNSDIKGLDVQVKAFFALALRCVRFWPGKDFLTMIDVARELKLIEGIVTASSKCLSFIE
ncbi:unnamed protein product [Arabidopsis arenosa]|uniref:Uncharacterized protein n=1 Tax=Arabidopsis arenosa TaxID=38785 RepID=A0A8S2ACV2_ARAAE|nr:unnamed protein product [Arabidopsis arenosa]